MPGTERGRLLAIDPPVKEIKVELAQAVQIPKPENVMVPRHLTMDAGTKGTIAVVRDRADAE